MLGFVRIVSPDGSYVVPSAFGPIEQDESVNLGQQDGAQSIAIFPNDQVQPGAVLSFGPFFQGLEEGASFSATGSQLRAGFEFTVNGEVHRATIEDLGTLKDFERDLTTIKFNNLEQPGLVMLSHPGSHVTVTVDGAILKEIKGSAGFANALDLDVNANRSSTTVGGAIADDAIVEVGVDTIGIVVKGEWGFPLN